MKFAVIALILGCSALACKFAVQSNIVSLNSAKISSLPDVTSALSRIGLSLLPVQAASKPKIDSAGQRLPKVGPTAEEMLAMIQASAAKHKVSATFVKSIVAAESNFNYEAVSPKGAIGLMQLMPETALEMGADDPTIPEQNIDAGTRYLRFLIDRYEKYRKRDRSLKRVIAAYNAGPGNVDRYRGVPPFRETRRYVVRVLNFMQQFEGSDTMN